MATGTDRKLSSYADIARVTEGDGLYAKDKGLIVKPFRRSATRGTPGGKTEVHENTLYVVKYNKRDLTSDNTRTLGQWRSIVTDGKKILSVAPPKSISALHFGVWQSSGALHTTFLEEFVEGTMINVFYDTHSEAWELATRSNIGARCRFFEPAAGQRGVGMSFRDMFMESMSADGLSFDRLDKACSYSFVLQHPGNRIVVPFTTPHLVLTAVYQCGEPTEVQELGITSETCPWLDDESVGVGRPRPICEILHTAGAPPTTLDDVRRLLEEKGCDYSTVGVVAHGLGVAGRLRAKVRNPTYEQVRRLRGNNPKNQFCYYSLRSRSKVGDFLKYYPEFRKLFDEFREDLFRWTDRLYDCYVRFRIKKEGVLADYPYEFRPHLRILHRHYLSELRPRGHSVTHREVSRYVNKLPPPRLMFAVNYHLRRHAHDAATAGKPAQSRS